MTTPVGFEPQGEVSLPNSAKPMLIELSPGRLRQVPLAYYGYNNGDDAYIFNVANNYLIQRYGGGHVELGPFTYTAKTTATPTWGNANANTGGNVCVSGQGANTVWQSTAPTAWFAHRTAGYGAQFGNPAQAASGWLRDFTIDGSNAPANAIGLDTGDGWNGTGFACDMAVQNYAGTGQIGVNFIKRVFWMEKNDYRFRFSNNTTAMVCDTTVADISIEYNNFWIALFAQSNQQGIVFQNGVNGGGVNMWIRGNMAATSSSSGTPTNNVALLSFLTGARLFQGTIWSKVEGNQGNGSGTTFPWTIYSDGTGYLRQCSGHLGTTLSDIQMNGAEFQWSGSLYGLSAGAKLFPTGVVGGTGGTSTSQPGPPATNTNFPNTGPDAQVSVTGGTVSNIAIGNVSTGVTSGVFTVKAGAALNITYTVAPTVQWFPLMNSNQG